MKTITSVLLLCLASRSFSLAQSPVSFRYFYFDSGELYRVLDTSGTLVEYTIDPGGNITNVSRTIVPPTQLSILNVTPANTTGGSTIRIVGQNFSALAVGDAVMIGGVAATVISATATQLIVLVPNNTPGGAITATVGGVTATWSNTIAVAQSPMLPPGQNQAVSDRISIQNGTIGSQSLPAAQNQAVSNRISMQNGTIGSQSLPTGRNQAISDVISAQNGTIGSQSLPTGQNQAVSDRISMQNGTIGSQSLLTGQNQAVSDRISMQNGTIGSQSLPTGRNQAVSKLVSAYSGPASNINVQFKNASQVLLPGEPTRGAPETPLAGTLLNAGETVTLTAGSPAQIYLNGKRTGNDPNSVTDLTFVVPEGVDFLRIHAGDSPDSGVLVQPHTTTVTGQVVDGTGAPMPNASVRLRHAGLEVEYFKLASTVPADEAPSIVGLTPVSVGPASSLSMRNPAQALGYFPIGAFNTPNFAVRFHGQFLAQAKGTYVFFVAATDGAQLHIDGKPYADAHEATPGLEEPVAMELSNGWHDIELMVYARFGSAQLVLSFTPPGGTKQLVNSNLLRAESPILTGLTDTGGTFTITVPVWLDQIEAIVTLPSPLGPQSGLSAVAERGVSNLGRINLTPGAKF